MLYPYESPTREAKSLDGIWRLCFDSERRGEELRYFETFPDVWQEIAVPGSINEQVVERAQYLHLDWVWYQTSFWIPETWRGRRVFLRFGAVAQRADVYVDGQLVGRHEGGYTPFELELSALARPGARHQLVVRVDSLLSATTLPQGGLDPAIGGVANWRAGNNPNVHWDAFPFMGIHRPVLLHSTPPTRLAGLRIETLALVGDSATLRVSARVDGPAAALRVSLPELKAAESGAVSEAAAQFPLSLSGVTGWCCATPQLYEVRCELLDEAGQVLDCYTLPYGVRVIAVQGGALLLNGEAVSLRGFGKHEDAPIIGRGLSLPHLVKDLQLLRWIGANSFRTSHYPYAEEVLQQADRHGILVIDEVAANTLSLRAVAEPEARLALAQAHRCQLDELVARDFNHACVIAWSLGNECETYEPNGDYFASIVQYARELDSSRPVLFVINSSADTELAAHDFDLIAVNLYPGWYSDCGNLEAIDGALEQALLGFWEKYKKPVLISEFGADAIAGMHSELPLMWSEEYQAALIERVLDAAAKYPFVIGTHVWNFADFKVGQHPNRALLNHKGVFTRERAPKLAAHALRRRWHGA